jgi:hypothetical protein
VNIFIDTLISTNGREKFLHQKVHVITEFSSPAFQLARIDKATAS